MAACGAIATGTGSVDVGACYRPSDVNACYQIGPFLLDMSTRVLTLGGAPAQLGPRAVAVLAVLVERPHEFVGKERILEEAWPGLVVEESNLAVQISAIRRALAGTPGGDGWS